MNADPEPRVLVNGEDSSMVDVADRGFAVGDGLFETVAVRSSRPRFWQDHCERLLDGCARLGIPAPDTDRLARELRLVQGAAAAGTARITITRGPGPRGYAPPEEPNPTRVVAFQPVAGNPAPIAPYTLRWCRTRLAVQPALAGIKHLNRLEQVLARAEWNDPAIQEGIMQSVNDDVVECVMSNLFLVQGERIVTPRLDHCGVSGVMRRQVIRAAGTLGIEVAERRVEPGEVEASDALFITNAVRGLVPVQRCEARNFDPNTPVLRRLAAQLETLDG